MISALEAGCIGVEADVWPYGDDLYVAHTRGSMRPGFTLKSTYLDPLRLLLEDRNCGTADSNCSLQGLYDADPSQTVVLLIDIKADAHRAWPILVKQLEPLRQQGWLSTVEEGQMRTAPITVVLSGRVLRASSLLETAHTESLGIFFDAPLLSLEQGRYNSNNSYWTSSKFRRSVGLGWVWNLGPEQLQMVRHQVGLAHNLGLKARYWGLPSSPARYRDGMWRTLLEAGLDIINVDDLEGFARFWERYAGGNPEAP